MTSRRRSFARRVGLRASRVSTSTYAASALTVGCETPHLRRGAGGAIRTGPLEIETLPRGYWRQRADPALARVVFVCAGLQEAHDEAVGASDASRPSYACPRRGRHHAVLAPPHGRTTIHPPSDARRIARHGAMVGQGGMHGMRHGTLEGWANAHGRQRAHVGQTRNRAADVCAVSE
jgi:hypothetical protein